MSKDKNKDLIVDENLGLNTPKKEEIDEPVVNEEDFRIVNELKNGDVIGVDESIYEELSKYINE